MVWNDPAEVHAAADAVPARTVLAPALRLWLVLGITWGVAWMLVGRWPGTWIDGAVGIVVFVVVTTAVVRQVLRDRDACRLFARAPRSAVALSFPAAMLAGAALWLVEQHVPGSLDRAASLPRAPSVPYALAYLAGGLWSALFDELAFRGVILQRLRAVFEPSIAVAVQAMMFAALHVDTSYVLQAFLVGCLAGGLRLACRALWPGVLIHLAWACATLIEHCRTP